MNITPIFTNFQTNLNNQAKNRFRNNNSFTKPNSLGYLAQDTVSFGIRASAGNTLKEITKNSYEKAMPDLRSQGIKFLDTVWVIAEKYKDRGVALPKRSVAEKAIVKGSNSFISKLLRSGAAPSDRIRTTMYVSNPYDFKLLREILDDFKLRGYEIDRPMIKGGGKKPDFDIRLKGVTEQDTKVLGSDLQKCIGEPLKTGYEDIQMRFVDVNRKKNKKQPIELIILYGENYSKAKEAESYYSYDIRRVLGKLLHISKIENPKITTPAAMVQDNVKRISQMLVNNISRPLFHNAKSKDFAPSNVTLSASLSSANCKDLKKLVRNIKKMTLEHYYKEIEKVLSLDYTPEIEKMIKASSEYKERADKTIYTKDISEMRNFVKKQLLAQKREDIQVLSEVDERLTLTIEKFGEKPKAE